jgi:hypothetical protein
MIQTAQYASQPDDVRVMRREADGIADIRMTQNYTAGTGEGEEAVSGQAQEVYFAIPITDAPTTDAIRANWDGWWDYGAAYTDGMFGLNMESFMRGKRDRLLQESDYLILPDYPLSDTSRTQVMAYRQALRDVTAQAGFPYAAQFPRKPDISAGGNTIYEIVEAMTGEAE